MKLRGFAAICALFALLVPAMAQEARKEEKAAPASGRPSNYVTRIFEIKYRDVQALTGLVGGFGAIVQPSRGFKAISATGPPEVVTAVGEAIKRFDVPVRNVEVTFYILAGLSQAPQRENIPKELDGVTKQLRSLFAYQGYSLLDTMLTRSREGQNANATGVGASAGTSAPSPTYLARFNSINVTPEGKANVIRIDKLAFSARVPVQEGSGFNMMNAVINTDVDVREGQKFVVGKTGMGGGDAMILVVTARVVE